MATYHKWFAGVLWIILSAVIVIFWLSVVRFSYNFPYYDDFQNIVQFVYHFVKTDSSWTKLTLLFEQNFEHRVIFAKLLTLLQYTVTGQIDIKWLIFIGNLSLLGVVILLYRFHSKGQLSLLGLFSITCLLFQLQTYEDTISWATCSLQHAPCLFFSLCSFYLALNRRNLYLSGGLALLSLFTSANGLSTVGIWLIIVCFTSRNRRSVIIPALILVSVTAFHLATLTIHSGSLLAHISHSIGPKLILLLSFAGQLADTDVLGTIVPSIILGVFCLAPLPIVLFQIVRRRHATIGTIQWFCVAGLISLLFVAFLIVFARGLNPDYEGYKMDRYKVYSAFFAAFAVAFYDNYWSALNCGRLMRIMIGGVSFVFCVASYYLYYGNVVDYRNTIVANQYSYQWSKAICYPVIYNDPQTTVFMDFALKNFLKTEKNGFFSATNWKAVDDSIAVSQTGNGEKIAITNPNWSDPDGPSEALYAVAVDGRTLQPKYLFLVDNSYQRAVKQFYTTFTRPVSPGFSCVIYKQEVAKGNYDIFLISIKKGQVARAFKLTSIVV